MSFFSTVQMIFSAMTKPKQLISLQEIPPGLVIDLGGGGEGVIAQKGGARIVAIDKRLSEIHEARGKSPEATWLVADATTLPHKSHSFDHATAFFSCMYMPAEVIEKAFKEAYRVLKPGGELWIWDVQMTSKSSVFAIRLQVALHNKKIINTVYGVKAKDQSATSLDGLLQEAGFETKITASEQHWFLIKAQKAS